MYYKSEHSAYGEVYINGVVETRTIFEMFSLFIDNRSKHIRAIIEAFGVLFNQTRINLLLVSLDELDNSISARNKLIKYLKPILINISDEVAKSLNIKRNRKSNIQEKVNHDSSEILEKKHVQTNCKKKDTSINNKKNKKSNVIDDIDAVLGASINNKKNKKYNHTKNIDTIPDEPMMLNVIYDADRNVEPETSSETRKINKKNKKKQQHKFNIDEYNKISDEKPVELKSPDYKF